MHLYRPARLASWGVVTLGLSPDDENGLQAFVEDLIKTMKKKGMQVRCYGYLLSGMRGWYIPEVCS